MKPSKKTNESDLSRPEGTVVAPNRPATARKRDPEASSKPDRKACNAIIFIPGIGEWTDQSLSGVTERISRALDFNVDDRLVTFSDKTEVRERPYGPKAEDDEYQTGIRTISRTAGSETSPVVDIYDLRYATTFKKDFESHNVLTKSLLLLATNAKASGKVLRRIARGSGKRASPPRERVQVGFGILVLLSLVLYSGIVLTSFVQLAHDTWKEFNPQPERSVIPIIGTPDTDRSSSGQREITIEEADPDQPSPTRAQTLLLFLTGLGVVAPGVRKRMKRSLEEGAEDYRAIIDYIDIGSGRPSLKGQLDALIEFVTERADRDYKRIDLVSYSFGTIVAFDTLFPRGGAPLGHIEAIDSFVTIGSPFDLIQSYWETYFNGRTGLPSGPDRWINIYSPADVLGSNYSAGPKTTQRNTVGLYADLQYTEENVPEVLNLPYLDNAPFASHLSLFDIVRLRGFSAHGSYWGAKGGIDTGCFRILVEELYGNDELVNPPNSD